jgi:polyisoprenoid-binding protein YceI
VATATGGIRLEGKSTALAAAWDGDTLVVTLPMASFRTGIELRDKHLREHIEADKYPTAELRAPLAALRLPAAGESSSGTAQAPLSFHGQVKPVSFSWQAKRGEGFDVKGGVKIDFTEFGVPVPSYLGVSVKPPAEVSVEFHVGEPGTAPPPVPATRR